jgi:hypothetical protein
MDSSASISVFPIIFIPSIFCCVTLSCGGYIYCRKLHSRQRQVHFTNNHHPLEAHAHVFTVDMPDTQPSNNEPSSSYLYDKPPPSYETLEFPVFGK